MTGRRNVPEDIAARLWDAAPVVLAPDAEFSIVAVSAATGIPRATLYYYFAGQPDLADFYADHTVDLAAAAAAKAAAEPGTVRERLRRALLAIYDPPLGEPVVSASIIAHLGGSGELLSKLIGFRERGFDVIKHLLEEGIEDGSFRDEPVEVVMATIFGALEMVALAQLSNGAAIDVDSVVTSIELLMRGLEQG